MTDSSTPTLEKDASADWLKLILILFEKAAPYLSIRQDMDHTRVSHGYALTLLQHEGGDRRVVEPAVILHDVGWSVLNPDAIAAAFGVEAKGEEARRLNRIHETEGAAIAAEILHSVDYDPGLVKKITAIIRRHDSGQVARSLEEELVKDADKLWRFSRTGYWQETKRQHLKPDALIQYLELRYKNWFFSSTALILAREELARRQSEIL